MGIALTATPTAPAAPATVITTRPLRVALYARVGVVKLSCQ